MEYASVPKRRYLGLETSWQSGGLHLLKYMVDKPMPSFLSIVLTANAIFPRNGFGCSQGLVGACCVFSSHLFWTSMDVPAGVTQKEGNTGFSIHLSAVLALIFLARRIQPSLSLVKSNFVY